MRKLEFTPSIMRAESENICLGLSVRMTEFYDWNIPAARTISHFTLIMDFILKLSTEK